MMGRGFAYLGVPPLFVGEIALVTGVLVLLRTGCLLASLATLSSVLLAATMGWVVLRTLPYVDDYGVDALRDSVVVMYGAFAFIVATLVLEDGRRLNTVIRYYRVFSAIYIPVIPFVFGLERYAGAYIPKLPGGANVALLEVRPGELAVHVAGALVFALSGLSRRVNSPWVALASIPLVMLAALSRGPMLAALVPIVIAMIVFGRLRQLIKAAAVLSVIFCLVYVAEPMFTEYTQAQSSATRSISTRQIVDNLLSITGDSGDAQTEATKLWRIEWWNIILDDTLYGDDFWTGRGFGLNLADADGFQDGDHSDEPPLRSPHSVNMTLLARAGVPGLTAWVLLNTSWLLMMGWAIWTAKWRGDANWVGLFMFICCYIISNLINASFDVALEGPMLGIWFWSMFGLGIGSVLVYRQEIRAS
jgi:hypothetical protein